MDLHVIIVIICVFLASLFSILFINKFFKNKTYEEAAAEKRAYVEKLYPKTQQQQKLKRKIQLPSKKELKKQQRKQNREQQSENDMPVDSDEGGANSIESISVESSPSHIQQERKHSQVMFNEPEIITEEAINRKGTKKDGKKPLKSSSGSNSILRNKSEHGPVKDGLVAEPLNHFDVKRPKDVVELWKQNQTIKNEDVKQSSKIEKKSNNNINNNNSNNNINNNNIKQLMKTTNEIDDLIIPKELKQLDEKSTSSATNSRTDSPKAKPTKQNKKSNSVLSAGKEKLSLLDKLDNNDVLSVQVLMSLLNRSELNRNDIQILIDYLLNKQQDTPAIHSEWSDDIVQKLRKQLNEKEKLLQEEQEASIGIQAKLRDLRTEINTERSQINSTVKIYLNEIELRKTDIQLLQQEIQNLNEKMQLERQQYQVKLQHQNKQAGNHQELLQEIQKLTEHNNILQNENVQKTAYITEIQRMANASSLAINEHTQKLNEMNVVYQEQINKIRTLETKLSDNEQKLQCQQYELERQKQVDSELKKFELEMAKKNESEKDLNKVEIRNLQNALETTRSELELTINELNDTQRISETYVKEKMDLKDQINLIQQNHDEKQKENFELITSIEQFKNLLIEKDNKLIEIENNLKQLTSRENDLLKQMQEQKEKNNDLRTKNWKLVEALQNAESKKNSNTLVLNQQLATNNNDKSNDEKKIRELLERLYPDECKVLSGTALTLSFEQWFEQIISQHIKNQLIKLEKNHQINNINNNTKKVSENNYNHHNHNNSSNTSSSSSNNLNNDKETVSNRNKENDLLLQNAKLKAQIEELTILVTKTENMLTNLETQAREQDLHWRSVVQSKQDEINLLKNSNGEEILDLIIES